MTTTGGRLGPRDARSGRAWRRRPHEVLMREAAERHRQPEQLEEAFRNAVDLDVLGRAVLMEERQVRLLHPGGAHDRRRRPVQS